MYDDSIPTTSMLSMNFRLKNGTSKASNNYTFEQTTQSSRHTNKTHIPHNLQTHTRNTKHET